MSKRPKHGRRFKRRRRLYRDTLALNHGKVPCYVCGQHVEEADATLEHVVPLARGGTNTTDNLAISHYACNRRRRCSPVGWRLAADCRRERGTSES